MVKSAGDIFGAVGALVATFVAFGCALHCAAASLLTGTLPLVLPHLHVSEPLEKVLVASSLLFALVLLTAGYRHHRRRLPLWLLAGGALAIGVGQISGQPWPGLCGGVMIALAHLYNRRFQIIACSAGLLLALLLSGGPALAHKLQIEPVGVTIRSQNEFLTADFRGNVQDITQSVGATAEDERGDAFTEEINAKVEAYINERFTLKLGERKLVGKLELLTHQGSLDPSASQFHLLMRYPRDQQETRTFTVHNTMLDYLPNARVIVSVGGVARVLKYGESVTIDSKNLKKDLFQNILQFIWMGIEHIFTGFDHILYILALLIASRSLKELIKTLTGFTIAHSITLCMAALGIFVIPERVVSILVPLSIVYVGVENILLKSHRHRFWIASAFGLVHGFGFADILSNYLPADSSRLWCLFSFNLGVEIFQVALCAVAFPLLMRFQKQTMARQRSGELSWDAIYKGASIMVALAGGWFFLQALNIF